MTENQEEDKRETEKKMRQKQGGATEVERQREREGEVKGRTGVSMKDGDQTIEKDAEREKKNDECLMEGEERVPTKRGKRQRDRGRDKTVIENKPSGKKTECIP